MPGIQAGGVGSGLDVNGLVTQLVAAEGQVKTNRINRKEAIAQGELSAVGTLKGTLAEFQSAIAGLTKASQLGGRIANNSSNDVYTVSTADDAPKGSYAVEVKKLAAAHKVSSTGFTDKNTIVGTGKLTFQFGTYDEDNNEFTLNSKKATKTIDITNNNSSLQGIRDSINNANIGVNASIIHNGTTDCLVFSSTAMGADNSLKITVDDDDGNDTNNSGLSQLAFDPTLTAGTGKNLTQTQAAVDAHVVIDGIDIYAQTNTVKDAIEGITLNLKKAVEGTITTTTVDLNTSNAKTKVAGFVKAFNTMASTLKELTSYDPVTKKAGVLNGDPLARGVQTEIKKIISDVVSGLDGKYNALADVGVTTTSAGILAVDASKLDKAISDDFLAIGRLFAPTAKLQDDLIEFSSYTEDTKAGEYIVNITQIATQGKTIGSDPANLTITTGVNDTLVFALDNKTATLTLTAGTYTAATLASELQSRINGANTFSESNLSVSVTESAGVLTFTSNQFGSDSKAEITSGNAKDGLIGLTPTISTGVDVAGTINGANATGSGRMLTGTGFATGLKLEIIGGSTGNRGTVNFTRGVADKLTSALDKYLGTDNMLSSRTKMLNDRLKDISHQRDAVNTRLEAYKKRLVAQFTALDKLVSTLRSTSNFLAGQLANIPSPSKE